MGWFKNLFNKKQETPETKTAHPTSDSVKSQADELKDEWEPVPAYIDAKPADYELVSVIATAIAAGNRPDSQFVVKNIYQRNPEAKDVSLIAASLAAGALEDSQFVVRSIHKKRN